MDDAIPLICEICGHQGAFEDSGLCELCELLEYDRDDTYLDEPIVSIREGEDDGDC